MINGVTIGGKHCYRDFGLVLTEKSISLPSVQKTTVSVPGRDGDLDLTEALDGMVHYGNRTIQLTFSTFEAKTKQRWADVLSRFSGHVHGQMLPILFDDDPAFYYLGRCEISQYALDTATTQQQFTVACDCQPYKLAVEDTVFVANLNPADREVSVENGRKPVIPTITLSCDCIITVGGESITVPAGTYCPKEYRLGPGINTVTIRTVADVGTLTVRFQRGEL